MPIFCIGSPIGSLSSFSIVTRYEARLLADLPMQRARIYVRVNVGDYNHHVYHERSFMTAVQPCPIVITTLLKINDFKSRSHGLNVPGLGASGNRDPPGRRFESGCGSFRTFAGELKWASSSFAVAGTRTICAVATCRRRHRPIEVALSWPWWRLFMLQDMFQSGA